MHNKFMPGMLIKIKGVLKMSDYVFKFKKGEVEIELKSDDPKFVEDQLDKWRDVLLKD